MDGELRSREVKHLAQGHSTSKWPSLDLNLGLSDAMAHDPNHLDGPLRSLGAKMLGLSWTG